MTRLLALAAFVAAPTGLYGCAPPVLEQAGTSCERLGLNVRVLDGELAQERLVLGAAARRQGQQQYASLVLTDRHSDEARAGQTLPDRPGGDLDVLQGRIATHEAALADARRLVAECGL